jgi:hypothetical protein
MTEAGRDAVINDVGGPLELLTTNQSRPVTYQQRAARRRQNGGCTEIFLQKLGHFLVVIARQRALVAFAGIS